MNPKRQKKRGPPVIHRIEPTPEMQMKRLALVGNAGPVLAGYPLGVLLARRLINAAGFGIYPTSLTEDLKALRQKFVSIYPGCENDKDIIDLYRNAREKWVGVFHQLERLPEVHGLAAHPDILSIAKFCGIKQPAIGTFTPCVRIDMPDDDDWLFPWHQDIVFNAGSLNSVTIWTPLQDMSADLGPLGLDAGSHMNGIQEHGIDGMAQGYQPRNEVAPVLSLGQALAFSQFTVHRSGLNRSNKIRFSVIIRYSDLACPEYQNRNLYLQKTTPPDLAKFDKAAQYTQWN